MADMPIEVVPLVIYALAFARVVYLVTVDDITEPARDVVISWLDDRPATLGAFIAKLITCPWCASVWLAAVAAPLIWFHGNQPVLLIPALCFALSQVAGMLSDLGR
jgi:uncharacterized protein DUF1360